MGRAVVEAGGGIRDRYTRQTNVKVVAGHTRRQPDAPLLPRDSTMSGRSESSSSALRNTISIQGSQLQFKHKQVGKDTHTCG